MKFTAWVFASAILTSVPAWSADIFTNELPRPFNLADPLESDASIGGYPIWNGDGKWRFVDATRRDTVSNRGETTPIGDVILFQTGEKRLVATMTVSANLRGSSTRWLGEPCKRDDLLFKANIGRSTWEDNCFTLNHITHYLGNPG